MTDNPFLPRKHAPTEQQALCGTDATQSKAAYKNVFIQSKPHEWSPARVLEEHETEAKVQVFANPDDGRVSIQTVSLNDYPNHRLPLQNVNIFDDLIDLPFLHEVRTRLELVSNVLLFLRWTTNLFS